MTLGVTARANRLYIICSQWSRVPHQTSCDIYINAICRLVDARPFVRRVVTAFAPNTKQSYCPFVFNSRSTTYSIYIYTLNHIFLAHSKSIWGVLSWFVVSAPRLVLFGWFTALNSTHSNKKKTQNHPGMPRSVVRRQQKCVYLYI